MRRRVKVDESAHVIAAHPHQSALAIQTTVVLQTVAIATKTSKCSYEGLTVVHNLHDEQSFVSMLSHINNNIACARVHAIYQFK